MRKTRDDDEDDNAPLYLSPAWHKARRLAREAVEAKATPAPPTLPSNPFAMPANYIPKPVYPKPKKIGASPLAKRRIELASRWRLCDVDGCRINTDGMSSLCEKHKTSRASYGHVKVRSRLRQRDYLHLIEATLKYWKKNPPPQSILESTASFLTPPGRLTGNREVGKRARLMLIAEMVRWQDPRYRKAFSHRPGYDSRKAGYAARDYLAVMVAVEAYIAEREGHGFPGEAEGMEKAYALVRLHKRPGRYGVSKRLAVASPPGSIKATKYTQLVSGTVLRAISARLQTFNTLGIYIHQTVQEVLKMPRKARKKPAVLPRPTPAAPPPPAPPPRQEPKPTRQVKVTLSPRYKKPSIGRIATAAELFAWQKNEQLWRQCPQGFYFETQEITT